MPGWLRVRSEKVATPSTTGRREGAAQGCVARVVPQGDRHGATADRIPQAVLDLDGQAEGTAGDDARRRLGLDRDLAGDLITGEVGNQEVGDRRAQPGGQVVAGPGGVAVVAVEDVVEIGGGERVEGGQGLGVAGQGRAAGEHPALVGDRDQAGPDGRGGAGARVPEPADRRRRVGRAAERAREDVVFLGGPGVHGDVGKRASVVGIDAGGDDAALPRRLGLDGAQAAASAPVRPALRPIAPGDFARGAGPRVVAGRVDHDRGTADGNDIGRGGRIVRGDLRHRRRRRSRNRPRRRGR